MRNDFLTNDFLSNDPKTIKVDLQKIKKNNNNLCENFRNSENTYYIKGYKDGYSEAIQKYLDWCVKNIKGNQTTLK